MVGQETGIFHHSDADPELLDFGGEGAGPGRSRAPQVKYTDQGPYGMVFTAGFENPVSQACGARPAQVNIDTLAVPTVAPCSVTGNTAANLPATTACIGKHGRFSTR